MSYIEELRQRVESAEQRFGLISEQERRYSERLLDLMNALEAGQEERQAEAAAHSARTAEMERENGELRGMLHALLLGVEAGSRDMLAGTLRDLDSRLSGMVHPAAPAAAAPDEIVAEDAEEVVAEEAPAEDDSAEDAAIEGSGLEDVALDEVAADEVAADGIAADEIAAEEITEDAARDEIVLDEAPEAAEADAVIAAEQAVAALLSGAAEGGDDEVAAADPAMDDMAAAADDDAGSPVADMIDRLADETQDFPTESELALDEAMAEDVAEPAPAPKPARKQA